ncbi:HEAT repeat domain-containing protein [Candidatus Desantisbacteria bacterium]|nr:HEAT repeat domain-containing protein [Candidatus Desantisbacteria bacterium]
MLLEITDNPPVTFFIPGQSVFLVDKKTNFESNEIIIPEQKRITQLPEDTTENKVKNLINKLKINYWNVSYNAQIDLIKMGNDAVPFLLDEIENDTELRKQALQVITGIGIQTISHINKFLSKNTIHIDLLLYEDLAKSYGDIGLEALNPLMELTKEKNLSKTVFVYKALEAINDKSTGTYLVLILEDMDNGLYVFPIDENYDILISRENYLKKNIIHTLGELKEKKAVPILISLVNKNQNNSILEEIAFALKSIQDPSSINSLIFLADKGYSNAVLGLCSMRANSALPSLLKNFTNFPGVCQTEILKMCVEIGDASILDKLLKLVDNKNLNPNVKTKIDLAIEHIINKMK